MPAIYNGNQAVRVTWFFKHGGQVAMITRHVSALNTAFDVSFWGEDLLSAYAAAGVPAKLKACISANASYLGAKTYYKPLGAPPRISQDQTGAGVGTLTTNSCPDQVCGLIQWKSAVGGARGRGRDYMPFPTLEMVAPAGTPTITYLTKMADFAVILVGGVTIPNRGGGGGDLVIYPCTLYAGLGPTFLPFVLDAFTTGGGFATQRRRGYYGRLNPDPFG
jgi:hypothetical protein